MGFLAQWIVNKILNLISTPRSWPSNIFGCISMLMLESCAKPCVGGAEEVLILNVVVPSQLQPSSCNHSSRLHQLSVA